MNVQHVKDCVDFELNEGRYTGDFMTRVMAGKIRQFSHIGCPATILALKSPTCLSFLNTYLKLE